MPFSQLEPIEAYDLWAGSYAPVAHNPLMRAEEPGMLALLPEVRQKTALDLGCGTGRYSRILLDGGAKHAVALDLSAEMLRRATSGSRVRASMTELPFCGGAFDIVVSGLAVGHVENLSRWMRESARVMKPDGVLLYSDFHPEAAKAGLKRSFRLPDGRRYEVRHVMHEISAHHDAANDAGLCIDAVSEIRVGVEIQERFEGSQDFYERWHGLPLVLVVRARKIAV
jgi:malonyl-CoA O-methyltransferase